MTGIPGEGLGIAIGIFNQFQGFLLRCILFAQVLDTLKVLLKNGKKIEKELAVNAKGAVKKTTVIARRP